MDKDGYVWIEDRKKDMILVSGFNVYPNEIENVVVELDGILEAAAIGVPDAIYGEEIACYVVVKPGETLGEDDVRGHCAASLAEFKVPKLVYFIDDLPKSDRG